MKYILVYDILSSGTTASLFGEDGKLVARDFCAHQNKFKNNYAQQSSSEWINAIKATTKTVTSDILMTDILWLLSQIKFNFAFVSMKRQIL